MWLLAVVDPVPQGARTLRHAGLAAVVEPDEPGTPASTALLLRQAAVVGSLLSSGTAVLPFRAGTRLPGEDVRRLLSDRHDELRHGLERVRGAVELAVRCHPRARPATPPTDGRAYLVRRAQQWRWADEVADRIAALDTVPGLRELRLLAQAPTSVKASLLVEADRADAVRRAVLRSLDRVGAARCAGPFAAYSFSTSPAAVAA